MIGEETELTKKKGGREMEEYRDVNRQSEEMNLGSESEKTVHQITKDTPCSTSLREGKRKKKIYMSNVYIKNPPYLVRRFQGNSIDVVNRD